MYAGFEAATPIGRETVSFVAIVLIVKSITSGAACAALCPIAKEKNMQTKARAAYTKKCKPFAIKRRGWHESSAGRSVFNHLPHYGHDQSYLKFTRNN